MIAGEYAKSIIDNIYARQVERANERNIDSQTAAIRGKLAQKR